MTRPVTRPFGRLSVEQLESRDVPSVVLPGAIPQPEITPVAAESRAGDQGPKSPDSTRFVTHLYQDILLRQPDNSGLTGWVNLLDTNTLTPAQVAISFVTSDEYRFNTVRSYYQTHLGRTPENSEVQFYVNRIIQGESQDAIRVSIFGSEEFFNRYARNNVEFVSQLYQQILGRAGSAAEIAAWVNILNQSGGDRSGVAAGFLVSGEYYAVQVTLAYTGLLHRNPDSAGFSSWVNQRASGTPIEAVLAGFLASGEYYFRA